MIFSIRNWFHALSRREKTLVGILAILLALTLIFYVVVMPFISALDQAEKRYEQSVSRQISVEQKVALLNAPTEDRKFYDAGAPDVLVSQSAGEAGFSVSRVDPQTDGRVNIIISSAKSTALFGWLAKLETRGLIAETLSVQPNESGTIAATITLKTVTPDQDPG